MWQRQMARYMRGETRGTEVKERSQHEGRDLRLRRHAIQLVAQLPENVDDAERIVELAAIIVRQFFRAAIDGADADKSDTARIVNLPKSQP